MTRRRGVGSGKNRAAWAASTPSPGDGRRRAAEGTHAPFSSKRPRSGPDDLAQGLYVVATPIGHSRDITLRALDVLRAVDVIACEDTRVTAKLLAIHAIERPLVRYDEHTAARAGPDLIRRIGEGGRVALVSDAGTPLISDPGDRLVGLCLDHGLAVVPVPGASSVLTALMVAGLPAERFLFVGFLPTRGTARRRALTEVAAVPASLVVLEGPTRLAASLADMADVLGPRPAAVARELTKLHEEVRRGTLPELAEAYAAAGPPKGEVTVIIGPPAPLEPPDATAIDALLRAALSDGSGPKQAARQVAAATGITRTTLYRRALDLKDAPK